MVYILYTIVIFIIGSIALAPNVNGNFFIDVSFIFIILYSFYNVFKSNQPPYSLRKIVNFFSIFFFGIAPWLQYKNNTLFWGLNSISENSYVVTNVILMLSLLVYNFTYSKLSKNDLYTGKEDVKPIMQTISTINIFKCIVISICAFAIIFALSDFNIYRLLFRGLVDIAGEEGGLRTQAKSLSLIVGFFIRPLPIVIFLYYIVSKNNKLWVSTILFFLAIVTLSPTGVARLMAASFYIPVLLILIPLLRQGNNFSMSFIMGLLVLFPFLNNFRYFDSDATLTIGMDFDMFLEGHFDAYQMFLNVVANDYVTWGYQLLGSVFFFIPRPIWPNKPIGSGATIAHELNFFYDNLSMPLVAEGYINFGFVGSFIFMILLAVATSKLDHYYWKSRVVSSLFYIQYLILIGMTFFSLRGDLINGIAYTSGIMCSVYFVSKVIRSSR